jgi:Tfp pilus assembly protein PilF
MATSRPEDEGEMRKRDRSNGGKKRPTAAKSNGAAQDPEEMYKSGVILLKRNMLNEATAAFRRALELRPKEARYLSYYGLCLAAAGNRPKEGLRMCEKAADEVFYRPELFLNLGKACVLTGSHEKAQDAFRKGLSLDRGNREIVDQLESLGIRKPPVFPFLDRKNALNKWVGLVRHKLAPQKRVAGQG